MFTKLSSKIKKLFKGSTLDLEELLKERRNFHDGPFWIPFFIYVGVLAAVIIGLDYVRDNFPIAVDITFWLLVIAFGIAALVSLFVKREARLLGIYVVVLMAPILLFAKTSEDQFFGGFAAGIWAVAFSWYYLKCISPER